MSTADDIRAQISVTHDGNAQRQLQANSALDQVLGGLATLRSMGHTLAITMGIEAAEPQMWPMMVYKADEKQEDGSTKSFSPKIANSEEELESFGEGWGELGADSGTHAASDPTLATSNHAVDEAKQAGSKAKEDGQGLADNPHTPGTTVATAWAIGHMTTGAPAKPEPPPGPEPTPANSGMPSAAGTGMVLATDNSVVNDRHDEGVHPGEQDTPIVPIPEDAKPEPVPEATPETGALLLPGTAPTPEEPNSTLGEPDTSAVPEAEQETWDRVHSEHPTT